MSFTAPLVISFLFLVIIFAFKSMSKKSLVWSIKYKSHQIEIKNKYDFTVNPPTGSGNLLVDNNSISSWGLLLPLPNKPFVCVSDISEEIQSIEIYGAGAFRTKLSIKVNDEFIYQDNLNIIDRYLIRNPKLIEKIKRSSGLYPFTIQEIALMNLLEFVNCIMSIIYSNKSRAF